MRIDKLVKSYKLKSEVVEALKGVSFDLPDKGMVFILGKSGCGKSTLLNVLSGLDSFDSGDIIYKGKSLKSLTKQELDSYRNTCCGFIFQEYNLIPELNVGENISLALDLQGEKDKESKISEALKRVDLAGYENRKVTELSGGQKQRIAIARSIVKDPEIIFADEPSGALDSETGASVFSLLKELSSEKLVIVVSHDRESAIKYGDRVIELSDGRVLSDTDKDYIEKESKKEQKAIRSKMPLRSALKIGCSNYKFHPIRMIATVLLAVFSFTFFGLSLALTTFNGVDPYVNAIYNNEYEYITIQKSFSEPYDYEGFTFDDFFVKNEYTSERVAVLPEDIATLQKYVSEDMMVVQRKIDGVVDLRRYIREWDDDFRKFVSQSSELITGKISGYMTITEEIIRQNGYELVGRLPQSINEAVMCEQHFNVYKYLGYKDDEGNEYEINDMEDIIGHTTFGFVITGVLKTGCDVACYNANHKEIIYYNENGDPIRSTPGDLNPYFFAIDNEYMFHEKLFVTHEYLVSTTTYTYEARENYIVFRKPEDKSEFKALTKFVLSFNNGFDRPGDFYEFAEVNETSQWYNAALVTSKPLRVLVLYVGVVFFIFTFVLLINFITTSVRGQMKQIGIISALGADFKQLYKIYFISAMVLCGIVYILSLITVGVGVAYLNSVGWNGFGFLNLYGKPFNILSLNFVTIISLLAISVISAMVGTILALRKMRKLSSAEIIRQGLIR